LFYFTKFALKLAINNCGHDEKSRKYYRRNFNRDLNGIGSEVVKTFEDSRMLELCTPVILQM
jgi:hypothetical protein